MAHNEPSTREIAKKRDLPRKGNLLMTVEKPTLGFEFHETAVAFPPHTQNLLWQIA
jgi:hypothetical protein